MLPKDYEMRHWDSLTRAEFKIRVQDFQVMVWGTHTPP